MNFHVFLKFLDSLCNFLKGNLSFLFLESLSLQLDYELGSLSFWKSSANPKNQNNEINDNDNRAFTIQQKVHRISGGVWAASSTWILPAINPYNIVQRFHRFRKRGTTGSRAF